MVGQRINNQRCFWASPRGFEAEPGSPVDRNTRQNRSSERAPTAELAHASARNDPGGDALETIVDVSPSPAADLAGVVETALAEALGLAARAGEWVTVARLAAELEARRAARGASPSGGEVVPLKASK